jgi:hypothetical protein
MSCETEPRIISIASSGRAEFERLPPDARMSAYLIQLTEGLGRLNETARRIDELSEILPAGRFKDDFELFRLDTILRIKGAKAEVERMTAIYLANLATDNN